MNSSRFPGKLMAKINGKPMIGHVYDNVVKNKDILETYVATCDEEIFNYIKYILQSFLVFLQWFPKAFY